MIRKDVGSKGAHMSRMEAGRFLFSCTSCFWFAPRIERVTCIERNRVVRKKKMASEGEDSEEVCFGFMRRINVHWEYRRAPPNMKDTRSAEDGRA